MLWVQIPPGPLMEFEECPGGASLEWPLGSQPRDRGFKSHPGYWGQSASADRLRRWCSIPKWSRGQAVTLETRRFKSARTPLGVTDGSDLCLASTACGVRLPMIPYPRGPMDRAPPCEGGNGGSIPPGDAAGETRRDGYRSRKAERVGSSPTAGSVRYASMM